MDSPTLDERVWRPIGILEAPPSERRPQPPVDRNQTAASDHRPVLSIHELFEEQARYRPHSTAVVQGETALTYDALNRAANRLAHHLRSLGAGKDVLVGIFMRWRIDMITALLAVLKAGSAYVPLDPACPRARLADMMDGVDVEIVLTTSDLIDKLPATPARALAVDSIHPEISSLSPENPARRSPPDLAYVVFAAGPAGKPAAMGVYHREWTNLVTWLARKFDVRPDDRMLLANSFGLDMSQRSIAMPLVTGGQLHVLTADSEDPDLIAGIVTDQRITLMNCTPGIAQPAAENSAGAGNSWPSLTTVALDGKPVSPSRVKEWMQTKSIAVANAYGAAECSGASAFYRFVERDCPTAISTVVTDPQISLFDGDRKPLSFGRHGKIRAAANPVAKRSTNDNALTDGKRGPRPFLEPMEETAMRSDQPAETAAETSIEYAVCAIFADALGVDGVSRDDDFFDLGGDSLKAELVAASITKRLGRRVPVEALFETRTVRGLCRRIETNQFWKNR